VQEEAGALLGLLRVHAARVLLQAQEPERALEMISRIPEGARRQLDGQYLARFEERALGDAINLRLWRGEDALLAGLVNQYKEVARRHRRFGAIARVTAEALRRLMLPERAVAFLQRAMSEGASEERDQLSLLAQLARGYRESGDIYRAERTVRYLVEQMAHREGWLGRREEIEIGLAAAEVSMDQGRWEEARAWLRRAWGLGGGDSVDAMLAYAHGRELLAAGDRKGAAEALIHAARNRALIPARRRVEVCLLTARLLEDFGRLDGAEELLRRLMAETADPEREVEVAWRLAHLLERKGEYERAYGLYAEIALRDPGSSYSKIASYRAEEVEFRRQHADALTTLEILQPIDE
jgi:tetratricopeptide (TPR) repeat protein